MVESGQEDEACADVEVPSEGGFASVVGGRGFEAGGDAGGGGWGGAQGDEKRRREVRRVRDGW